MNLQTFYTNIRPMFGGSLTEEGVPAGYEGPNGVRLFDPGVVNIPRRVWA